MSATTTIFVSSLKSSSQIFGLDNLGVVGFATREAQCGYPVTAKCHLSHHAVTEQSHAHQD